MTPTPFQPPAARFSIGEAARRAGVSPKMVRHYEGLGLLPPASRTGRGLRRFSEAQVHTLRFIARARSLGFGLRDVARLLSLWNDRTRSNAEVLRLAEGHLADVARKAEELRGMAGALEALVAACAGDGRPECPILDDLADAPAGH
ncbi:MAG: MerR family transcriptional regulator [Acetobacteraceae bacterium]|nr:MerR family transcriptional regulator [Acetobacteraceae bacterium]